MEKAVNKLMQIVEGLVTSILAIEVIMVVLQIFSRYILGKPLNWTDQMSRFGLVWIIMLGIPVMFNRKATVAFDLIFEKTKGKTRKAFKVFFNILGIMFAVVFLVCSIQYVQKSGSLVVPGFSWMRYKSLYSSEVVGSALLLLVMLKETLVSIAEPAKDKEE